MCTWLWWHRNIAESTTSSDIAKIQYRYLQTRRPNPNHPPPPPAPSYRHLWTCSLEFFLNGIQWIEFIEFSEFVESDIQWSMNWAQFKDPVSHMSCKFEPFYCYGNFFCHWICWIQCKHLGKNSIMKYILAVSILLECILDDFTFVMFLSVWFK